MYQISPLKIDDVFNHGPSNLEPAVREIIQLLSRRSRHPVESTLTYEETCHRVKCRRFHPREAAFHEALTRAALREYVAGRGLASALVVHENDGLPGRGYFNLAENLGFDISDRRRHHAEELQKIRNANQLITVS